MAFGRNSSQHRHCSFAEAPDTELKKKKKTLIFDNLQSHEGD